MSESDYKCNFCSRMFSSVRGLNIHAHHHFKDKLKEKSNFKVKSKKSPVEKIERYSCPLCTQKFVKLKEYKLHYRSHNIDENIPECNKEVQQQMYIEDSPAKMFEAMSAVENIPEFNEQHQQVYSYTSPAKTAVAKSDSAIEVTKTESSNVAAFHSYKCPNCDENFSKYRAFQSHLCSHLNICDYSCNNCLDSFRLEKVLISHNSTEKIHGQNFCCTVCKKTFKKAIGFQSHKSKHMYKPPYYCPICGRKFFSYSKRLRHIQHHTNKCAICKVPIRREDYFTHVLKVHGNDIDVSIPDSTSEEEASSSESEHENAMKDLDKSSLDNLSSDSESERVNAACSPKQKLICFICEQKAPSTEALDNHIKLHNVFRCPTCSKYFCNELKFKKHVTDHVTKSHQNKNSSQRSPLVQSDSIQSNEALVPVDFVTASNIPNESRTTNDDKLMATSEQSAGLIKSDVASVSQSNSQEFKISSAISTDDFACDSKFSHLVDLCSDVIKKSKTIEYPISDVLCQSIVELVTELNAELKSSNDSEKKNTYKQLVDGLKSILIENVHAKCN